MSSIREQTENFESLILCKHATLSKNSRGRLKHEEPCNIRTDFQRDRDRIVHCKSFRRLKQKTQVFISPKGDHYRTRLTHTLEVAQISRTVARALRLNEDLTEAIALGHDLGHTPFGHAGESALNELCPSGFKHYMQSVRLVSHLEKDGQGLNLTQETINGIMCHTKGDEAFTPEGRIVRICDKVAYINHDIEDALSAGVIKKSDIPAEFINEFGDRFSQRIDTMVSSIIECSVDGNIRMSDENEQMFSKMHDFMYSHIYLNKKAFSEDHKVPYIIASLYDYFMNHYDEMPVYLQKVAAEESLRRAVCDYIAGMTDYYATAMFKKIFIPKSLTVF